MRHEFERKDSELTTTKRKLEVFEASQDEEFSTNFKKRNKLGEYADEYYDPKQLGSDRLNTERSGDRTKRKMGGSQTNFYEKQKFKCKLHPFLFQL